MKHSDATQRMLRRGIGISLLLASLASVNSAQASDGPDPALELERSNLYSEGVKLAGDGRWEEARARFLRVVEIRSTPKTLFTLAQAEEKSGRLATAKRTYLRAQQAAQTSKDQEVMERAPIALRQLSPAVPRVSLRLPSDVGTVEVTVDGEKSTDTSFDLDPGKHRIQVQAAGRQVFQAEVEIGPWQAKDLLVSLPSLSHPVVEPPRDPSAAGLVFLSGGIGAVAGGIGVLVWSAEDAAGAAAAYAKAKEPGTPAEGKEARAAGDAAVDRANAKQLAGGIAAGVGAGLSAVGLYLLLKPTKVNPPKISVSLRPEAGGASVTGCVSF